MENDEGWWFQAVLGFWFWMDRHICESRVTFATEKLCLQTTGLWNKRESDQSVCKHTQS